MHRSDEAERQQPDYPWLAVYLPLEPLETWRDRVLDAGDPDRGVGPSRPLRAGMTLLPFKIKTL
jgi:hypothetical protein